MNIPSDLHYTETHEWIKTNDDNTAVIGVTDHAQSELGDVVYIEFPSPDDEFEKNSVFGTIESVKATSDLHAPVDCTVIEINEKLDDAPEIVNSDPYGDAWIIKVKLNKPMQIDELLTSDDYQNILD